MDLATIIGLVAAFGLIVWSILLGGSLSGFIDMPSVAVVIGGTMGALLINFPLKKFLALGKVMGKTFMFALDEPSLVIDKMVKYAERARREGMLALEEDSENETDPFLRKGLRLAVDGTDPQLLEKILDTDVEQIESRHSDGAKLLGMGGTFAPAYGMIGTLIGLVNMLSSLEDPTQIGAGMATALITTFYGAVLANAIFIPLQGKLEIRSAEELVIKAMIIEGIMAIQSGDSPRIVEEKLKSFLSPTERAAVESEEKAA
ncbi:MAG: motility protein A [bacterium]|nr:motility protein A [bacterium]